MPESETVQLPVLGAKGEPCERCRAPLAPDQRYCLACGHRRGGPRVPYTEHLGSPERPQPAAQQAGQPKRDWTPVLALGGLALLALVLVIGVLIGKSGSDKVAGTPQVIRLGGGGTGGTGAATAQTASFKSDWPAGKKGWTVEIGELPKSGTTPAAVAAAKSSAQQKGAAQVGALDSDQYASLTGGKYVVYSGVYDSKKQATAALSKLKGKFPQAKVVQVSDSGGGTIANVSGKNKATVNKKQLQQLNNLSGNNYEKQSRKLPTTTVIPGKPPSTDTKAPGGGSGGGQTIK